MNVPIFLAAAAAAASANEAEMLFIWRRTTPEGKAVVFCLIIFSIVAWSVMIAKAVQHPGSGTVHKLRRSARG